MVLLSCKARPILQNQNLAHTKEGVRSLALDSIIKGIAVAAGNIFFVKISAYGFDSITTFVAQLYVVSS